MCLPRLSLVPLVLSLLVLSGCGEPTATPYTVKLEVWGVFDDSDVLRSIFGEYKKLNPSIKEITYRKLSPETYKTDLLDALASGTGPDVFMVRNTWQEAFDDKVVAAPSALVSVKDVQDAFVDVVTEDFVTSDGAVLALPLSVDSLALYYNKDLLNAAGITAPPTTWEELLPMVQPLTTIDLYGNITRSAAALGTGDNINRSADLLLALMLQQGEGLGQDGFSSSSAAAQAFGFYRQFSKLDSPFYTWSPREHYSIDAFVEGTLAMTVNYSYHYETFRQKNAKLNFAVAPLPQFANTQPLNFANYWGFAVAKNKTYTPDPSAKQALSAESYTEVRTHESWQLIRYLAMPHPGGTMTLYHALTKTPKDITLPADPAKQYLEKTKKPAARRDLIREQQGDVALDPFVRGNLIAKTWRPGSDVEATEALLVDAINAVNRGERTVDEALSVFSTRFKQFRR